MFSGVTLIWSRQRRRAPAKWRILALSFTQRLRVAGPPAALGYCGIRSAARGFHAHSREQPPSRSVGRASSMAIGSSLGVLGTIPAVCTAAL